MVRVLVLSHIRLYREAIAETLNQREVISAISATADSEGWAKKLCDNQPDVILFDTLMPGALDHAKSLLAEGTGAELIALGISDSESEILACVEAGVSGFVSRGGSIENLVQTIRDAMNGELKCSPQIAKSLARRLAKISAGHAPLAVSAGLTRRELEIAELIDQGLSNKIIARSLNIEVSTVKNHVHYILQKLNVHRRGEAAALLRHCFDSKQA